MLNCNELIKERGKYVRKYTHFEHQTIKLLSLTVLLYCTVLYKMYCSLLNRLAENNFVLWRAVMYCTVLSCPGLYCIAVYCTVLFCSAANTTCKQKV